MLFDYTITALMFPAVPIMLLVYGNRFSTLSKIIRTLHDQYLCERQVYSEIDAELDALQKRVTLMRAAQFLAGLGFLLNMLTMFALYFENQVLSKVIFGLCMVSIILSILLYMREIQVSVRALRIHIADLDSRK